MRIRLAIAEDNAQTRTQYVERFRFYDNVSLVYAAESGDDLLDFLHKTPMEEHPDIVLMDIEMPGTSGIATTVLLKEHYPYIDVIMSTVFKDEDKIFQSIQAGASGYLLNDSPIDQFVEAMEEVLDGGVPLSRTIARKVLTYIREQNKPGSGDTSDGKSHKFGLSARELEILKAVVNDETEYAIAYDLGISEHTVRSHVKNIYRKLQVHSRTALVKKTLKNKLI